MDNKSTMTPEQLLELQEVLQLAQVGVEEFEVNVVEEEIDRHLLEQDELERLVDELYEINESETPDELIEGII